MNVRKDRPINWLGRAMVACLVLGMGILAAIPYRRESPPPITNQRRVPSDSVRLVFRNQDITLQVNPQQEASPADLSVEAESDSHSQHTDRSSPQLPDLPQQYRSLLDPHSTTPQIAVPPIAGTVHEPVPVTRPPLREHVLVDGDTLDRLAERYLGSAARKEEIRRLNPVVLADPETLPLGKVIMIPAREATSFSAAP